MKKGRGLMILSKALHLDKEVNSQDNWSIAENVADENCTNHHVDNRFLNNNTEHPNTSILPDSLSTCDEGLDSNKSIKDLTTENNPERSTEPCISESLSVIECNTQKNNKSVLGTVPQSQQVTVALPDYCGNRSPSDNDFDSDDSVLDKDYVPFTQRRCYVSESDSDNDIIPDSQQPNVRISESPELDHNMEMERTDQNELHGSQKQLTKKGTIRKRKAYDIPLTERKKIKWELNAISKYFLKPGCNESCKKKCSTKIPDACRLQLNKHFRAMNWTEQRYFIRHNTSRVEPKRRRSNTNKKINRTATISYFLTDDNSEKINVCKIFFLTTLGFNKKNDKAVRNALKERSAAKPQDNRGLNPNPKKKNNEEIISHINSFNPSISHYRREHAPNRRYFPSDLNARAMYKDFCEKYGVTGDSSQENHVSYDHYRRVIKSLNISFARLGNEECEICEMYKIHNPNSEIRHRNCTECIEFEKHHKRYVLARQKYEEDKKRQMSNNCDPECDTMYYSADLEKVIMLPRINEFKVVMFCPRLIVFNESFVPLGDKKSPRGCSRDTFACIWHEAISGRKKDDICSCFQAFFTQYRDMKHIVLWLDNCAAQNKNWGLFSYLVHLVNSDEVNLVTITLRFLEVGHTYMSADEFHHQVELSIKKKNRLYDFEDFHAAVLDTNRKITVKKMDVSDFCAFEDCSSAYKLQNSSPRAYLNRMREVIFRRGCYTFSYKNDFEDEETELDFLRMKNLKLGIPKPKPNREFRGIKNDRKSVIINKLVPLMPENRRQFWHNLHSNENSVNLVNEHDD